jgi:hypothetical protein
LLGVGIGVDYLARHSGAVCNNAKETDDAKGYS